MKLSINNIFGLSCLLFCALINQITLETFVVGYNSLLDSHRLFLGILDSVVLFAGVVFLVGKRGGVVQTYRHAGIFVLNGILFFIALNLISYVALYIIVLRPYYQQVQESRAKIRLEQIQDIELPTAMWIRDPVFMRKTYGGMPDEDIVALMSYHVDMVSHPRLEFMAQGTRSKFYNVLFEGVRLGDKVDEASAREKIDGGCWLFGGSTMFGHGLPDDQTIASYLNRLAPDNYYLNFGMNHAHQLLEIDKLVLLLKKGYRPAQVVFFDGLNDIHAHFSSDFSPMELPRDLRYAYGFYTALDNFIKARDMQRGHLIHNLVHALPVTQLLTGHILPATINRTEFKAVWADGYEDIYSSDALYHTDPETHFQRARRARFSREKLASIDSFREKIITYYQSNIAFLTKLSQAYDFDLYVFFQPLGTTNPENPFIKNGGAYFQTAQHLIYAEMQKTVRQAIRQGQIERMIDLSDLNANCPDCYVDLTHYNAKFNRLIAEEIHAHVTAR